MQGFSVTSRMIVLMVLTRPVVQVHVISSPTHVAGKIQKLATEWTGLDIKV